MKKGRSSLPSKLFLLVNDVVQSGKEDRCAFVVMELAKKYVP